MTEIETIQTIKPWYKRVIACFCAFLICCLVCFCGFSIPTVYADEMGLYESYLDSLPGKIVNGPLSASDGVALGLQLGLQEAWESRIETGSSLSASSITTFTGKYLHNNQAHLCWSGYSNGSFSMGDGGVTLAKSDEFEIRCIITANPAVQYLEWGNSQYGTTFSSNLYAWIRAYSDVSLTLSDSYGSSIFPQVYNSTFNVDRASYMVNCFYSGDSIPILNDDSSLTTYFGSRSSVASASFIAGWNSHPSRFNISDIPGASDFSFTSDNFTDFITNIYNPWIEEEFPDLVIYLFDPNQIPTETTSPSGCGCHVDVYVDVEPTIIVEPTINVYVNPWELPSDEQDYTLPTTPAHETIPFPTQDSSNTEPVTMPTMDLEEFQQTYKNAFDFWFYCAEQLIEKMNLQILLAFVFVVTVVGFIMWKLGG